MRAFERMALREPQSADATLFDPESRKVMDAYARGVNQFIEQHKRISRWNFHFSTMSLYLGSLPILWLISGYMYRTLTDTWERELNRAKVTETRWSRAREGFAFGRGGHGPFVVGDPKVIDDGSQRSAARARRRR